ncbi:relaxase domain-containing protein [Microbacterium sp.]|uniref:relaxase domain-containing protein n=1 Tax=Microbacterium sp. TaxID=51671 RepID=UPI00352568A7
MAAALHADGSAALDAAQDRAAKEIVSWVADHATTRVGPRGRQVQVPMERVEAAVIRHLHLAGGRSATASSPADRTCCTNGPELRAATKLRDSRRCRRKMV